MAALRLPALLLFAALATSLFGGLAATARAACRCIRLGFAAVCGFCVPGTGFENVRLPNRSSTNAQTSASLGSAPKVTFAQE